MNLPPALTRPIFGVPTWVVGIGVIAAGVGVYFFIRGKQSSSANALGQSSSPAPDTSQIDPYTGVPYSIEGATNPATGLPAYYGGPGVDPTPTPTPTDPGTKLPPPVKEPGGQGLLSSKVVTTDGLQTLSQYATANQTTASDIYYNNLNAWLKAPGNFQKYLNTPLPKGKTLYLAGAGQHVTSSGTGSGPNASVQATPWWPEMTDVQNAQVMS